MSGEADPFATVAAEVLEVRRAAAEQQQRLSRARYKVTRDWRQTVMEILNQANVQFRGIDVRFGDCAFLKDKDGEFGFTISVFGLQNHSVLTLKVVSPDLVEAKLNGFSAVQKIPLHDSAPRPEISEALAQFVRAILVTGKIAPSGEKG